MSRNAAHSRSQRPALGNDETTGATGGALGGRVPGINDDSRFAPVPGIGRVLGSMKGGATGEAGAEADGGAGGTGLSGASRRRRLKAAVTPQPNPQTPRMM